MPGRVEFLSKCRRPFKRGLPPSHSILVHLILPKVGFMIEGNFTKACLYRFDIYSVRAFPAEGEIDDFVAFLVAGHQEVSWQNGHMGVSEIPPRLIQLKECEPVLVIVELAGDSVGRYLPILSVGT